MVRIGRINKLRIKRKRDYGAHLDGGAAGDILLPAREVPAQCQAGDELEVFVYADKGERLRATISKPKATAGQFARLQVTTNATAGSYLDWGLEKDLFVPAKEQLVRMAEGRFYVVFILLDEETNRITASAKLDKFLSQQPPPYVEGEEVELFIYDKTDLGYKALVNKAHGGMLYKNEVFQEIRLGEQLQGYIKKIRPDFKIDLRLQPAGYQGQGIDDLAQTILDTIKERGGWIGVTDKSPAAEIHARFGVSKKIFKKAIGALYKKKLIVIDPGGIKLSG
jgi:hypothetical protein